MTFNIRCGLIFLISLLPALAHAANETVQIHDQYAPLFQGVDDGLSLLMNAAGECRSTDANLYECLCAESTALQKLDSALRFAFKRKSEWKGEVIYYGGATLQVSSLEKQVEDIQKQCGV